MSEALTKQAQAFAKVASERATAFGKVCDSLGKWYLDLKKYNGHY
jgi:hypothetical protein